MDWSLKAYPHVEQYMITRNCDDALLLTHSHNSAVYVLNSEVLALLS